MSDITWKIFPNHSPQPTHSTPPVLQKSIDLVIPNQFFKITTKFQSLSEIYSKLQSSLPSAHMHDRDAM